MSADEIFFNSFIYNILIFPTKVLKKSLNLPTFIFQILENFLTSYFAMRNNLKFVEK
jgi:hypothetical protein